MTRFLDRLLGRKPYAPLPAPLASTVPAAAMQPVPDAIAELRAKLAAERARLDVEAAELRFWRFIERMGVPSARDPRTGRFVRAGEDH